MTRGECYSKGCPFIKKKPYNWLNYATGLIGVKDTYICTKCNKDVKKIKVCPKEENLA
jgi:hypothetical protein